MHLRRLGSAHVLSVLFASAALLSGCLSHERTDLEDAGESDAGTDASVVEGDGGILPDACACIDGGPRPPSCEAEDAHAIECPIGICDGLDTFAWDGERCVQIDCGTCTGADCDTAAHSMEACALAHASCEPQLCASTGGSWLFFAEECGHYVCGMPGPRECLVGAPVCNCGPGKAFTEGVGCTEVTCPEVDPLPAETLCGSTGGAWTDGICCSPRCGTACLLPCTAAACVCGDTQIFDTERGCIDTAECHVRPSGDVCDDSRGVRCADGLLCCLRCGGAGCESEAHCQAPVCDSDPDTDSCGNNRFAP